jgi:Trp operon repressor
MGGCSLRRSRLQRKLAFATFLQAHDHEDARLAILHKYMTSHDVEALLARIGDLAVKDLRYHSP